MFSIVIPLYNKSVYISKAIQSVLDQNYQNFELIIVNDGSTDQSAELVKSIIQEYPGRIKLIYQENSGVSNARNRGVYEAQYDYVAFLDADDWWESDYLQQMAELIETNPNDALYATS